MFPNPEVQIAACEAVRLKVAGSGERQARFCRRSEVRGPSDHPRNIRCDSIEDFGGRVAPGYSLAVGGKDRNIFRPVYRKLSLLNLIQLRREFGEFCPVLRELFLPLLACFTAPASQSSLEVLIHCGRNEKLGVSRPAIRLLYKFDLFFAQRLAVCGARILAVRRAIADMTLYDYDGRSACRPHGIPKGVFDSIEIVGIPDTDDVPSVGKEPRSDIFSERDIRLAFDGDAIVIVDPAEVIELEVPGERGGLAGDAFHHATVAAEGINPIPEQFKAWFVVSCCEPFLCDGHSHACGHALSQRPGGCLDARSPPILGVPRAAAPELPKRFEVLQCDRWS